MSVLFQLNWVDFYQNCVVEHKVFDIMVLTFATINHHPQNVSRRILYEQSTYSKRPNTIQSTRQVIFGDFQFQML